MNDTETLIKGYQDSAVERFTNADPGAALERLWLQEMGDRQRFGESFSTREVPSEYTRYRQTHGGNLALTDFIGLWCLARSANMAAYYKAAKTLTEP